MHGWDGDLVSQGRLGNVDVQVQENVIVTALEIFVRLDLDDNVQISGRAAVLARLTFAGQPNLRASVDSFGDGDDFAQGLANFALAVTGLAGINDYFALALTGGTGGHLDHRAEDGPLGLADFAAPVTGGALGWGGARFGAASVAGFTALIADDLDFFIGAENGFFEVQFETIFQVAPRRGAFRALRPERLKPKPNRSPRSPKMSEKSIVVQSGTPPAPWTPA